MSTCVPVGGDELLEIARGTAVRCLERLGHDFGDLEKGQPPLEECGNCNLVGGVEDTRIRPRLLAGAACERKERESLEIWSVELQRHSRSQVERRNCRCR